MNITEVCIRRPVLAWMIMAATILFGIVPGKLLDYATTGARALFS